MIEVKTSTQTSIKLKDLMIVEDGLIDEDGVQINLMNAFKSAFGNGTFCLSATSKQEESVTLEEE